MQSMHNTHKPLYNTVLTYMVLDTAQFKDISHKCINYIENAFDRTGYYLPWISVMGWERGYAV